MTDRAIAQPQPGLTYRITYDHRLGQKREATGRFVGLENDPVIPNPDSGSHDKVSLHFILTEPVIRDLHTQTTYHIDAPRDEDVHFHVWPEDLVALDLANLPAPHAQEDDHHEEART